MDSEQTFFFYDLETSGLNPREDRLMQFAGIRTDMDLKQIGDQINVLVKLSEDTLPSPYAIMVTKITPQSTLMDGFTEAEFCKFVMDEIFTPGTIAMGYNSVRFDDEFMRHTFWRNFYDPYEWQWKDGRSKWDLLDVVRMTRALRPEGIEWPVTDEGKATNRLELITKCNNISHEHAHDALSDVEALISVTRLIKEKQPQLYDWLFKMRDKKAVQKLINLDKPAPFVYSSGRYSSEFEKTTVAYPIAPAKNGNVLVFDLRQNLDELMTQEEPKFFPVVKELKYNHCPAIAPLGVLEQGDGWKKIQLTKEQIEANLKVLLAHPEFIEKMRTENEEREEFPPAINPESALYDGFLDNTDKTRCDAVRRATMNDLADFHPDFHDPRLPELLLHYKARNFEKTLSESEHKKWEEYRIQRIKAHQNAYIKAIQDIAARPDADSYVLQELQLWYQSLLPY
ncbi:MAG: exodeoxyribonuclease I [Candidatus Saccharibacteria bacterium]|nr:exodeoxyribonuclease I [Candidatus Saccharibacteria bacterium]